MGGYYKQVNIQRNGTAETVPFFVGKSSCVWFVKLLAYYVEYCRIDAFLDKTVDNVCMMWYNIDRIDIK